MLTAIVLWVLILAQPQQVGVFQVDEARRSMPQARLEQVMMARCDMLRMELEATGLKAWCVVQYGF